VGNDNRNERSLQSHLFHIRARQPNMDDDGDCVYERALELPLN
jgi:hypothetical protein